MSLPIPRKILFALFSFILTLCLSIAVAHSSGQSKVVEELSFTAPTAPEWNSGLAVQSLLKQTEDPDLVPSVDFPLLARDFQSRVGEQRSEETISTVHTSSKPPSSISSLLQKGLQLYQSDRFTESIQIYQQAIADSVQRQDVLTEALAQRYLALAYQELGQWQPAKAAIERSLNLLKTLPSRDSTYFEVLAKALNTQGRHQFQTGQVEAALKTWKQATVNYQKAGQQDGIMSSLINQAIAQQALGFSIQSQETLTGVRQALKQSTNATLKSEGLSHLGEAMRRLGALSQSRDILQESFNVAEDATSRSKILLEMGNTERAIATRSLATGKETDARKQTQTALDYYQRSRQLAKSDSLKLQAQLNAFGVLVETRQPELANQRWQTIQPLLANLSPNRTHMYAQLNAAQHLVALKQHTKTTSPADPDIAQLIAKAYQQAKTLQDPRTESYALGQLGALYESNRQWSDAKKLTLQALLRLEGLQASDLRYRWEWQLGRLLKQQGDRDPAIEAYTRAITALQSVRENLLLINPDVQFSFRDRVEPIYRDLTALLLQSNATTAPTQTQLQSAIANIDSLQLAELENFLRCDLSQLASASQDLDRLDPRAAFIYPIILSDRIEVIVRFPGQPLNHYTTKIEQGTVEQTLRALRQAILRSNASRVIEHGKQVYTWLVEPLESDLAKNRTIETLVFVLDGDLRNVPMPVLYDAKTDQYLVEKPYAIALLPTSQLFDLKTLPQAGKVLGAGISEPLQVENRRFDALNAKAELSQVQTTTQPDILLNAEFTQTKLQEKLRSQGFSIVHLVTHGNFSSDPEDTYLLLHSPVAAKGELLKPNDLTLLLRPAGLTSNRAIDLLVLSACKTAEGDNRATLGLVGLAVRAGARSTLGTLWQVSDDSTIALMNQFYDELKQPGTSKAKALHRAQLSLLQNTKYQNPYHWAPYILVGNWL
jgi:CHAT domain-containing protein